MKKLIYTGIIAIFLLTSCSFGGNTQSAEGEDIDGTRVAQLIAGTVQAEFAAATASAVPPTPAPTETVVIPPTETATPEPTATPTEIPVVKAAVNVNTNCRLGPDKVFALVELLNAGNTALVIGQYTRNGQWWKVRTDTGKECWVLSNNVSITGDTLSVALLESPPTPTPVPPPNWAGDYVARCSTYFDNPEVNAQTVNITINQTGNQIKTNFRCYGYNVQVIGTVSPDGMSVSGSMQFGVNGYVVRLVRVASNLNQFQGEFYRADYPGWDGVFCGGTKGSSYPVPCRP